MSNAENRKTEDPQQLDQARTICDRAIAILRERGVWGPVGSLRVLTAHIDNLEIGTCSPRLFGKSAAASDYDGALQIQEGRKFPGSHLWIHIASNGNEVFSIWWGDDDLITIETLWPGAWQQILFGKGTGFAPGGRIRHRDFGPGTVTAIRGSKLMIRFDFARSRSPDKCIWHSFVVREADFFGDCK